VSSKALSLLSRTRDAAGSHKVPRTIAGTKLDVLPNGLEASDESSDDCVMLDSDHETASPADGREAGPSYAPLLRAKDERREADPTYAPLLRAKEERTETVADASDASDDCIFCSNGNKQVAQHRPTDGGVAAVFKPIKDEQNQA